MKKFVGFFISIFLFWVGGQAQNHKFALHTEVLDAVQLLNLSTGETIQINGYQKTGGGYLFECADPSKVALTTKNPSGEVVKIKVFDLKTKQSTDWVDLKPGEKRNLAATFQSATTGSWWNVGSDILNIVVSFFNECRNGSVVQGKDAAMKSAGEIFFKTGESLEFSQPAMLHSDWFGGQKITKISLRRAAGGTIWSRTKYNSNELKFQNLPIKVKQKLKPGQSYFLEIETFNSAGKSKLHQQKIYILSELEYKKLQNFIN